MGIFLAPLLLAMLLGFSFFGLKLAFLVVANARNRASTAMSLLASSSILALLAIVLPFACMAATRVSQFSFIFASLYGVATVAALAGIWLREKYRYTGKAAFGLWAAALYLAAASLPITWFLLSEPLGKWFGISWSY